MSTVIVYTRPDGGVSVVYPTPEMLDPTSRTRELLRLENIDFSDEEEVIDYIQDQDVPDDALDVVQLDESKLPKRVFRNAWVLDSGFSRDEVIVDVSKAQEIQKGKLRALRDPKLVALDAEYMKALESGDKAAQAAIAAQKQELRDVTDLPMPTDLDELEVFVPDVLKSEAAVADSSSDSPK